VRVEAVVRFESPSGASSTKHRKVRLVRR
jgi:hypothetical protein